MDEVLATVNFATEKATVTVPPSVRVDRLIEEIEQAGYGAEELAPTLVGVATRCRPRRVSEAQADRCGRVLRSAERSVGPAVAVSGVPVPVLLRDDLGVVPDAIRLARATFRTIRCNLAWAFGYNIAAIPLAATGFLNPLIAGAAMAASSTFVVGNSVRLRRSGTPADIRGRTRPRPDGRARGESPGGTERGEQVMSCPG